MATVLLGAAIVLTMSGCLPDPREDIDLADLLEVDPSSGLAVYMEGGRDVTEEVCDTEVLCLQAIEAPGLRMLRFDTLDEAAAYADVVGDEARQARWVVADYSVGDLSQSDRRAITSYVDGLYVSEDGGIWE